MAQRGRKTIGDESLENWELLGSGGFGYVYSAEHKDWGKVAIKLPKDGSGQSYDALCREADYMEAADQQYVPMVHGMYQGRPPGLPKGRQGIVMELMEGGSLQTLLQTRSKPPPWPLAFRLALQVAQAMDFLHSKKGLVHMDLKPDNILLDAKLNAKIADFGLSMVSNSVSMTAGRGVKGGTLAFIPPEAFEDDYHRVRSYDVYSYAILLWTILTGDNTPYPGLGVGGDFSYAKLRIQRGDRPLLDKIDVQQAAGLGDLVEFMERCWDPEPENRPSFTECIDETRRVFSRHEKRIDAAVCEILKELKPLEELPVHVSRPPEPPVHVSRPPVPAGSTDRKDFLPYVCELTLDPNTACRKLSLSENNMKVTRVYEDHQYPDHPDRFKIYQVMCRERLTGRCYWEVEWRGGVSIAVTYRGINREGDDSVFGHNDKSWSLLCNGYHNIYTVSHNKKDTDLPVRPSSSGRVSVYVDWSAGTVSFYTMSSDTLTHLYTFQSTITEPLYAGFLCWGGSSVSLCVR